MNLIEWVSCCPRMAYVVENELWILLLLSPKCWDYSHVLHHSQKETLLFSLPNMLILLQ